MQVQPPRACRNGNALPGQGGRSELGARKRNRTTTRRTHLRRSAGDGRQAGRAQMVRYRAPANYQRWCEWICRPRIYIPLDRRNPLLFPQMTSLNSLDHYRSFASIPSACSTPVLRIRMEPSFAVALVLVYPDAREGEADDGLCCSGPPRDHTMLILDDGRRHCRIRIRGARWSHAGARSQQIDVAARQAGPSLSAAAGASRGCHRAGW